ncbi:MAG: hypothetical protein RL329_268, partial [Bacteroidota bacterium]
LSNRFIFLHLTGEDKYWAKKNHYFYFFNDFFDKKFAVLKKALIFAAIYGS